MATAKHSPEFRKGLSSIVRGDILVPPLRSFLSSTDFGGITIHVPPYAKREPDGWFHPSTHPLWPERALWLYLLVPEMLIEEPRDHGDVLALTVGTIWHEILETAMEKLGLIDAREVRFEDPDTLTKGSADAVREDEVVEIKTMKAERLRKVETVEDYLVANPTYHAQALDYMRMSGYRKERVLLMSLTYPYEMREFVIPYDMGEAQRIAEKYRGVIQDAHDGRVPMCSGCKGFCPAKAICQSPSAQQILEGVRANG